MLKQQLSRFFVSVGLFALLVALPSAAQQGSFVIVNETGVDIYELYIGSSADSEWGEDLLEDGVLMDGESIEFEIGGGEADELWDIQVLDDEGNSLEFRQVPLLEAVEVHLDDEGNAIIR